MKWGTPGDWFARARICDRPLDCGGRRADVCVMYASHPHAWLALWRDLGAGRRHRRYALRRAGSLWRDGYHLAARQSATLDTPDRWWIPDLFGPDSHALKT